MDNQKKQILAFRKIVPMPISETRTFLANRNWDVDLAIEDFKNEKVVQIFIATGEDIKLVEQIFIELNYDEAKTYSYFKQKKEDTAFDKARLNGLNDTSFQLIHEWEKWENNEGIIAALQMKNISELLRILKESLLLGDLAQKIEQVLSLEIRSLNNNSPEIVELKNQLVADKIKFEEQLIIVRRNYRNSMI